MTLLLPTWTSRQPLVDTIHCIDAMTLLRTLPDRSINCVVTSPPYFGLRDYKSPGQIGLEKTPQDYIDTLVALFRQVRRVLRDDGVVFLNLGDSYAGSWGNYAPNGIQGKQRKKTKKGERWERSGYADTQLLPPTATGTGLPPKSLIGIPWRVAIALQGDGWTLRSAAPWIKASAMPESVQDRPTTAHEYVFQFSKSETYWFDREAVLKPFKQSSIDRINQPTFDQQTGGEKDYANGVNSNRSMRHTLENFKKSQDEDTFAGRNRRTTDTFLDAMDAQIAHWQYVRENGGVIVGDDCIDAFLVNTKPLSIAHFATFPLELVEPCILSGCPDKVCTRCGAPWKRLVEYGDSVRSGGRGGNAESSAFGPMDRGGHGQWDKGAMPTTRPAITTGWQPTCDCCAGRRPGVVLDPFMGSGTTALAARANGRAYIGSELNPDYVAIAKERLRQPLEKHHVVKETKLDDLPLFSQVTA